MKPPFRASPLEAMRHAASLGQSVRGKVLPIGARLLGVLAILYFLCPVDLLPDFLPGGYADDVVILAATAARLATQVRDRRSAREGRSGE